MKALPPASFRSRLRRLVDSVFSRAHSFGQGVKSTPSAGGSRVRSAASRAWGAIRQRPRLSAAIGGGIVAASVLGTVVMRRRRGRKR